MDPSSWARKEARELAQQHFAGKADTVERLIVELAEHHEWIWRRRGRPNLRPTSSMYALALRWELQKRGAVCAFCTKPIELPAKAPSGTACRGPLAMGPRVPPTRGGLNVPQNLALGHDACLPPW